ncbi:hypothetical protein ACQ4M3_39705 [Leptolyngbya sp. AN03gr2]
MSMTLEQLKSKVRELAAQTKDPNIIEIVEQQIQTWKPEQAKPKDN